MQILVPGCFNQSYTFKCNACGCLFVCDPSEFILQGEEIIRESYDGFHRVVTYAPYTMAKCPCCGRVAKEKLSSEGEN